MLQTSTTTYSTFSHDLTKKSVSKKKMYSGVAVVFILAVIAGILLFVQLGMNQNAKSGTIRAISTDDKKIKTKLTQDDASFSELFKTNLNVAIESKKMKNLKKKKYKKKLKLLKKLLKKLLFMFWTILRLPS